MGDAVTGENEPLRFTLPMRASFRETASREQAIGSPIRWRLETDVIMQGIVVDWIDRPGGDIDLVIEVTPSEF